MLDKLKTKFEDGILAADQIILSNSHITKNKATAALLALILGEAAGFTPDKIKKNRVNKSR